MHPNPVASGPVYAALGDEPRARVVTALDYAEFIGLLTRARLAITDSGGVQEAGPTLGVPVLVTRQVTERPEGVAAGAVALVGTDPDRIGGLAVELHDPAGAPRRDGARGTRDLRGWDGRTEDRPPPGGRSRGISVTADGGGRRFGAQVVALTGARLSSVIAFFGITVVGARLLTPEALGSAAVGQTVGMIAALVANAGINISTIYFLQQRPAERAPIVQRLVAIAIGAISVAIGLVLISSPIVFGFVLNRTDWPLLLAAAAMGSTMIAFEFSGALMGLGPARAIHGPRAHPRMGLIARGRLPADRSTSDGRRLRVGHGPRVAAAAVMGLGWTRSSGFSLSPRVDTTFSRTALGFGLRGQIGNVFQFLGVRLDVLLVPALLDLRAAGVYYVAVRVSDVVGQAATAAASLIFPRVAALADRRSTALTERVTRMTLWLVAAAALGAGAVR